MTVQPLGPDSAIGAIPDIAVPQQPGQIDPNADAGLFSGVIDGLRSADQALQSAQKAETAFANGQGDLQSMVFERARADSILSVASAGASKATQALNTILNMQV